MEFYHNLITQKSFDYLKELGKKYDFILIGGWAVYLWSRALKSKDIDIIVSYEELAKLKENQDIFKNDRLKKYEVKTGEFDIDIYLEHYSQLGIGIKNIKKSVVLKSGFQIPSLEMLFFLKLYAYGQRKGSAKGQKDELDIFSLAVLPEFNWDVYKKLIIDLKFKEYDQLFKDLLKNTRSIKELDINEQKMSKIKKNILSSIRDF
jgi:hypothetical protein